MIEDNWDLITGDPAHSIEVLNYSNQVNVIEALVLFMMHHHASEDGTCTRPPLAGTLNEFHRTATLLLLSKPGHFREEEVVVSTANGTVVHQPPEAVAVGEHLEKFFEGLSAKWPNETAQELAGYALWMINWIHPFKNGNGRTARAFSYAVLSLKLGFILPGEKTVIDLIMDNRDDYQNALKVADNAFEANGEPDLAPVTEFIDRLLAEQFSTF
ncbi:Fic family protein [Qipengyuania flava]|uniref:Fic family protein n=1 Tax=Qipengyuania flava TaxID=192812 RepID=UPI0012FDBAEB|nr:Fic family protein [Qipengyuania flava]